MFPYPQAVNPSLRTHLESQTAFLNDFSSSISTTFQNIWNANLKLGQAMLEETTNIGQRLLTTKDATEALQVIASSAQPATNNIRAYQQHLSRLAADAQVDFSRVSEQHAPETSRTARDLLDEVTRSAAEQADHSFRQQREAVEKAGQAFDFGKAGYGDNRADATSEAQRTSRSAGAGTQSDDDAGGTQVHGGPQAQRADQQQGNKKSS
jgi:phasin family protein